MGRPLQLIIFASLSIGFACAAVACGNAPPPPSPANVCNEKHDPCIPDCSIVFVKDLQSYIEDCGCSGGDKGGLPRVAVLAEGVDKTFYFLGQTFFAPGQAARLMKSPTDSELKQAVYQLNSFAGFFPD